MDKLALKALAKNLDWAHETAMAAYRHTESVPVAVELEDCLQAIRQAQSILKRNGGGES